MVVAIDDRADVWNWSKNLIKVQPYNFFRGTNDINAPSLIAGTSSVKQEQPSDLPNIQPTYALAPHLQQTADDSNELDTLLQV